MMGVEGLPQERLFLTNFSLDRRVRAGHPLRRVASVLDLSFVYGEVRETYGVNGNVSVPPPVIVKLLLLLVLYNVRSERELMETLPERLDWLWFLGYDLDTEVPDHSVLSKARKRWGEGVFRRLFERVVLQCVEAGLIDGRKVFLDASLVEADASPNSVVDLFKLHVAGTYRELTKRLEERDAPVCPPGREENGGMESPEGALPGRRGRREVNRRYVSGTDPDAAIVRKGTPDLYYKVHRAVDGRSEVITATEVTSGDVNEAHRMAPLLDQHASSARRSPQTVVADMKYGTVENFLLCSTRGLKAHIPDLGEAEAHRASMRAIFPASAFTYDAETDTYRCPQGQRLPRKSMHLHTQSIDYAAPKSVCQACPARHECTRNVMGRTIKRHFRQEELTAMREASRSSVSRRDIRLRQHWMERSFARAGRYGFKRSRWRGLWKMRIQEYLIATLQNLTVLLRYGQGPRRGILTRGEPLFPSLAAIPLSPPWLPAPT